MKQNLRKKILTINEGDEGDGYTSSDVGFSTSALRPVMAICNAIHGNTVANIALSYRTDRQNWTRTTRSKPAGPRHPVYRLRAVSSASRDGRSAEDLVFWKLSDMQES